MLGILLISVLIALTITTRDVSGIARVPGIYFVLIGWSIPEGIQGIRLANRLIALSRMESTTDQLSCLKILRQVVTIRKWSMYLDVLLVLAAALINPTVMVFIAAIVAQGFLNDREELRKTRSVIDEADSEAHA